LLDAVSVELSLADLYEAIEFGREA
jgi:hypothetical protein